MAGFADHGTAHISRSETYLGREVCAVGMIAADRQHWYLQFAFGQ
jgi:hypothetical protein